MTTVSLYPVQFALIRDDGTEPPADAGYRRRVVWWPCDGRDYPNPALDFGPATEDWGWVVTLRVIGPNGAIHDYPLDRPASDA